ncbi:MAG: CBS domain-containing protein [Saprospiraceae bacterium]|nr:CBS domain-containing protein [Saprospiraceae bacterium]
MKPRVEDRISLIMTDNPICLEQSQVLKEAREIMSKYAVRHIPVKKGKNLVGIISKADMDRIKYMEAGAGEFVSADFFDVLTVGHVMTKSVNTIQHDDTIKEAAEILSLGSYHALPVMDGDDIVGIVTTTDLLLYLLKLYNV